MSPLLAILRLCTEQFNNLSEDQVRGMLGIALEQNSPAVARKIRATVTKPVLVKGSTFKMYGKKVTRKPHRRSKPGKRRSID